MKKKNGMLNAESFKKQDFDKSRAVAQKNQTALETRIMKMQTTAEKNSERRAYSMKYIYVKGGHILSETIGFLTVLSANKARGLKIKRNIKYDESDKTLYLNTYERKDRDINQKSPVFVNIHGGGWIGGLPEMREAFTTRVAEAGYFVASMYYGHSPFYPHPEPIQNIYKVFAWLKQNAEEYNIDTEQIFVGGESAGAHLTAMAAAISTNDEYNQRFDLPEESRHQKFRGLVLNCGVYDLEKIVNIPFKNIELYVQSYCGGAPLSELTQEQRKEISPIHWVTKDFPPVYAISAENDNLALMTFDFIDKLRDLGVPVSHYHGKGRLAVHAFAVAQILKISREAMFGLRTFLRELTPATITETSPKQRKKKSKGKR